MADRLDEASELIASTGLVRASMDLTRMANRCLRENRDLKRRDLSVLCALAGNEAVAFFPSEVASMADLSYGTTMRALVELVDAHLAIRESAANASRKRRCSGPRQTIVYELAARGLRVLAAVLRKGRSELPQGSVLEDATLNVLAAGMMLVNGNGYPRRKSMADLAIVEAGGGGITQAGITDRLGLTGSEARPVITGVVDEGWAHSYPESGFVVATEDGVAQAWRVASTLQDLGTTRGFKAAWSASEIGVFSLIGER